jgi:Cu-Zn family superoxide dismutase
MQLPWRTLEKRGEDTMKLLTATLLVVCATAGSVMAANPPATATILNATGQVVGRVILTESPSGLLLEGTFRALPPGTHAIHIHEAGLCDPPDFKGAGGHFNPTARSHGIKHPQGPHAGDLPNLEIDSNGNGSMHSLLPSLSLTKESLLHEKGTAMVIHADPDDYLSQPAGNAGARIACGVITQ